MHKVCATIIGVESHIARQRPDRQLRLVEIQQKQAEILEEFRTVRRKNGSFPGLLNRVAGAARLRKRLA
ncbi:hypothetical protein [Kordiimonas gwangyangensis]|uniref:hypothetical protein n=1 Tax=Kordiimonas gwangyangensis TaxID=288022 RepID=UPI00046EEB1F|nr:hypothetical protein [Kordiimonas gwangyangensis]